MLLASAPTIITCEPCLDPVVVRGLFRGVGVGIAGAVVPIEHVDEAELLRRWPLRLPGLCPFHGTSSAHMGAPPGSMQVQPLVPAWMTFICPSAPIFKMVAPFNTAAGAASFSLSMSSWSVTTVCCATAPEMAATRDELTASIMILRFMAPFSVCFHPVLARVPIGFLDCLPKAQTSKRRAELSGRRRQSSLLSLSENQIRTCSWCNPPRIRVGRMHLAA